MEKRDMVKILIIWGLFGAVGGICFWVGKQAGRREVVREFLGGRVGREMVDSVKEEILEKVREEERAKSVERVRGRVLGEIGE